MHIEVINFLANCVNLFIDFYLTLFSHSYFLLFCFLKACACYQFN
nr:MAG TPA: hypothetical protein [Caudoviricetes sp.]